MQVNRKFIFTVDQLELIRRLRNSGLTKEQVLCAFDSFECLDSNVNKSLNIPMTLVCDMMKICEDIYATSFEGICAVVIRHL